jgi:MGT family glycosyltransferase
VTRFLFVVPPLAGHVNPAAGVAAELSARGHRVAFVGDGSTLRRLLPERTTRYACQPPAATERPAGLRNFAALKFLWESMLVPLAESMVGGVLEAVATFLPDVLVVDQQAIAGALVAERLGLPWVTSATTSSELTDPLAGMPKLAQWLTGLLDDLRARFGDPRAHHDLRFSPHLVLAFTSEAMLGGWSRSDIPVAFVGPVRHNGNDRSDFPAGLLDQTKPLVFVSLGTVNVDAGRSFLQACVAALGERPSLQGLVVDPSSSVRDLPANVLVRRNVAQLAVLAHASSVVCHAGHNTVCEALSQGLPLVVAPIRDDQPIVAEQVTRAGAGIRLRFDRASAEQIGAAVDAVLTNQSYRDGAARIQNSFRSAGGSSHAADRLLAFAR